MRRVVPVLLTGAVIVAGLAVPAGAEEPGYGPDGYGEFAGVRNVLPGRRLHRSPAALLRAVG